MDIIKREREEKCTIMGKFKFQCMCPLEAVDWYQSHTKNTLLTLLRNGRQIFVWVWFKHLLRNVRLCNTFCVCLLCIFYNLICLKN